MFEVPMKVLVLLFCTLIASCVAGSSTNTSPVFSVEDPIIDSYKEFQKTCHKFPKVDLASTQMFVHCENSICTLTRLTTVCVEGDAEFEVESIQIQVTQEEDSPPKAPPDKDFMI